MCSMTRDALAGQAGAVSIDAEKVRGHVDEVVRTAVGQALDALLDANDCPASGAGIMGDVRNRWA